MTRTLKTLLFVIAFISVNTISYAQKNHSVNNVTISYRTGNFWHNYCNPCDTAIVAVNNNDKDVYIVIQLHDCRKNIFSKRQAKLSKGYNGALWTFTDCTAIESVIRVDFCEDFSSYAEYLSVLDKLGIKFD
jgi:hypothetical protein